MYLESLTKKFNLSLKEIYPNFINGEWVNGESLMSFEKKTPITGQVIYSMQRSSDSDVNRAVEAARKASKGWGRQSPLFRATLLQKIADVIEKNKMVLACAETLDAGKLIKQALYEVEGAAEQFRYFAACVITQEGSYSDANQLSYLHIKEPLGVVGAIIPWNYPLLLASWKIAPALAVGNAIIIKPSEQSALSLLLLIDLIKTILPKGVLNVVTGFGNEAGKALASHPDINKIVFTGGMNTGQSILRSTAENVIPSDLELGGKSPQIFFEDVTSKNKKYFDKAVESFLSFTVNQGQTCACLSRAIIHKDIYEEFINAIIHKIKKITIGDPFHSATMLGPLISEDHFQKVVKKINSGIEEGAICLFGGETTILKDPYSKGYYIQPALITGNNKMAIFQDEIFGPVVCIATFEDDDEALELANDSSYGLAAGIWTRDAQRIHKMTKNIIAGRIWVNCLPVYPVHAAFGGVKKSGFGRESHKMSLDSYQYTKSIIIDNDME